MTKEELDALHAEVCKPYSREELDLHKDNRILKSWLEITHAHNYDLIDLLDDWVRYLDGEVPRPGRKLWMMLRPGRNNDNAACARLHDIAGYFAQYEHGNVPRLPIVVYASRSTVTLIDRLDDFHTSGHLTEACHHIKEFFWLITYEGDPKMSRDEFAAEMRSEIDAFIDECAHYADELGELIRKREAELNAKKEPMVVQLVARDEPLKVEVVKERRRRACKLPLDERDSVEVFKADENARVIHEINARHRADKGSYPKIIKSMMSDPVWAARMRHRGAETWKRDALRRKGR